MCILYLFNYQPEMTLDQIAEHMGFNEETAKKNVQSLMTPTMKILTQKDNKFSVNLEFKSPKKKNHVPNPNSGARSKTEKD
jgi:DNA-binding transcriptional regulator LsrR (DeoR family)